MDPWKDCLNFTDEVLVAFIKGFPSHPDHATAVVELMRRCEVRQQRDQARAHQAGAISLAEAFLTWAIGWIASLRFSKRRRLTA
jgi:hypothetical protein